MNDQKPTFAIVLAALASLALLFVVGGCSGGGKKGIDSGNMYESNRLEDFVADTGPPLRDLPEYRIGIGDRLDLIFVFHSNLTQRDVLVREDGRITMPYVGDQVAMGFTPTQLDSILTERFSEILREPNLAVAVRQPARRSVYVLGMVNKPGGYPFETRVSLAQSIALAGGAKRGGKLSNTVLIRRQRPGEIVGIEVDVKAILNGESVQNDILLRNLDIVYVPQTGLNSVEEFAASVSQILALPVGTTLQGWQIANTIESYKFFRDRRVLEVQ